MYSYNNYNNQSIQETTIMPNPNQNEINDEKMFNHMQLNMGIQEKEDSKIDLKSIPRIRVICRKRPLSKKELAKNEMDIIEMKSSSSLVVKELK